MVKKYILSLLIFLLTFAILVMGGGIAPFIDTQSMLYVFGIGFLYSLSVPYDRLNAFADGCVRGGWLMFIIGLIFIFGTFPEAIERGWFGPALSVNIIPIFYGYFVMLIVKPLVFLNTPDKVVIATKPRVSNLAEDFRPFTPKAKRKKNLPVRN